MKSIIQEASSIVKAVEKGWEKAGKPAEFTIKVYEEPQKNFIGMTTKPAKIGIFFQEVVIPMAKSAEESRRSAPARRERSAEKPVQAQRSPRVQQPRQESQTQVHTQEKRTTSPARPLTEKRTQSAQQNSWSPEMIEIIKNWLNGALASLGRQGLDFSVEVELDTLKLSFNEPVLPDKSKDKILFRSFAFLLMQTLRNKMRNRLRGLKIMLVPAK